MPRFSFHSRSSLRKEHFIHFSWLLLLPDWIGPMVGTRVMWGEEESLERQRVERRNSTQLPRRLRMYRLGSYKERCW